MSPRRLLLAALLLAAPAAAGPIAPEDAPAPLQPWVKWVLHGNETALCPFLNGQPEERVCAWPAALRLELSESGGRFSQSWRVYAEGWVPLPGDTGRWPQEATVDGSPAAVLDRGGVPSVRLKAGTHAVAGAFRWDALPELLDIPSETGLLSVSVAGAALPFPARDERGRLWLQKARGAGKEASHIEVSVHRRLIDDVPLQLVTQVQLRISGRNREELLGKALPAGFIPMSIVSPLPARLDPDGRLRVQARAGTWDIELTARRERPAAEIVLPAPGGTWDDDEAWAFEAREDLRSVTIEGVPSVDPSQTEMPPAWRGFPTYLMQADRTMKLVERRRGDANPDPDRLSLQRTFWLDFKGKGLSVQDQLSGKLSRGWRLTMGPETALGRVSVGGADQFLTALSSGGPAGVEVRQGALNAVADSRVERRRFSLPAVGWAHDFERVGGVLNLPPGWRLVHAWGVDRAEPSWVTSWTLLDLFLVLILALAVDRLWGRRWGLAALAGAGLSWHEPGALRWCWLAALAAEALVRGLPDGTFRKAARGARALSWTALVLWAVPFMVRQVRTGLFPQLENHDYGLLSRYALGELAQGGAEAFANNANQLQGMVAGAAAPMGAADDGEAEADKMEESNEPASAPEPAQAEFSKKMIMPGTPKPKRGFISQSSSYGYEGKAKAAILKNMLALDPRQAVSTGPGLPSWNWRSVTLTWRGPVRADQRLRLWLIGPRQNLLLSLLRVLLTVLLALNLFGLPVADWLAALRQRSGWTRGLRWLFPVLLLALAARPAPAADWPDQNILNELRQRLIERPDCAPVCAESPRLRLEAAGSTLRGRLEVHAAAATAVPLPGGAKSWTPVSVVVDGAAAVGLRRAPDGTLWLPVGPGSHQVLFEGPLPDGESVSLPLPLKSRRVEATVTGWSLHGLREDGRADDNLQLVRLRGAGGPAAALQPGNLPPFVLVERVLRLGLSWQVETRVRRLTPTGTPVTLEVPLLPGESVTSDVNVKNGKAQVSLSPQAAEARWDSVLAETGRIALKAPDSVPWVEAWRLEAGPIWHAEPSGLAPVQREAGESRAREWRPWPGEAVAIAVTRPAGVPGRTLTIDAAQLSLSPGLRASDATLTVRWRSSRGGQHVFTLPDGAELQTARLDGALQPARLENGKVTLPVKPGSAVAELVWREPRGMRLLYKTSTVGLGASAVNADLRVAMPPDRWILCLGGPRLGPAVLFWSLLSIFLLVSAGLGKLGLAPLDWRGFFLLSLGLTQVPIPAAALVAGWLNLLGWRRRHPPEQTREFDSLQVFIAMVTLLALLCLFSSIKHGLLGLPDMQVGGNGSSASLLHWYKDRTGEKLPRAWVFSLPLGVYRFAMLSWAMWLAHALLGWLKWGWECFSTGGLWKRAPEAVPPPPAR